MIRRQGLAVLLEGQQHVAGPVEGPTDVDGGAVRPRLALGQLALRALEVHVAVLLAGPGDAEVGEHIAEPHAGPHAVGRCCAAPVEADGLLHHVLLLTAVACADEGHREAHDRPHFPGGQVVHGQLAWLRHAGDLEAMLIPGDLGHGTMVPHHVEGGRRDPARLLELGQRRLRVEGVSARQPDHVLVTLHPAVRRVCIARVYLGGVLAVWHGQARVPQRGGQGNCTVDDAAVPSGLHAVGG
mmetsp:Transcript_47872/g.148106  ORF Transcript_47872/g.148106 Transcript_47872/m.148106 type:complete len:241 (+) Transcript_47872:2417-3139(+)